MVMVTIWVRTFDPSNHFSTGWKGDRHEEKKFELRIASDASNWCK